MVPTACPLHCCLGTSSSTMANVLMNVKKARTVFTLAQARMGQFSSALAAYSRAADLAPGIAGYRLAI